MAENVVINDTTYNGVDALSLVRPDGSVATFYPDAVRYNAQNLTEAQKAQARKNIGAQAELSEADQEAIVQQVITALGTPVFGTVDADKRITLSIDHLAHGTYSLGYEDKDGNWVEIGTYEKKPAYTNALTLAVDSDGKPYNGGQGWKDGYRLNSSGAEAQRAGMQVSGFIPAKYGDVLRMRDITFNYFEENSVYRDNYYLTFYNASFAFLGYRKVFHETIDTGVCDIVINDKDQIIIGLDGYKGSNAENVAYIRISATGMSNDSVITINQEIPE